MTFTQRQQNELSDIMSGVVRDASEVTRGVFRHNHDQIRDNLEKVDVSLASYKALLKRIYKENEFKG